MRTFIIRALGVLAVMLWLLPFTASPANGAWAHPFRMRVVDQQTRQGLSGVRLTSDNGLVCYTRADGSVLWTESALMDRDVSFRVDSSTSRDIVSVHVVPGGFAEIAVTR